MTLAVNVLQTDPAATGQDIGHWALAVLQRFSGVEISGTTLIKNRLGIIQPQNETTAGDTDVDLFVCEQDEHSPAFERQSTLAISAGERLAAAGFGRVRTKVWRSFVEFPQGILGPEPRSSRSRSASTSWATASATSSTRSSRRRVRGGLAT